MNAARARLMLIAASLAIAALIAEAALRVSIATLPVPFLIYLNPQLKDRLPATWVKIREWLPALNIRQEDHDVGWTFKPNLSLAGTNEEGERYAAKTSSEGFFTPDQPPRSVPQLVTVGASFLSTFYVPHPLQDALRAALDIPVYNLAVGGWGPGNYLAAYDKFASDRRHELVVVLTVPSDIGNAANWDEWKAEQPSESYMTWMQRKTTSDDSVNRDPSWPNAHLVLWNLWKFAMRGRLLTPTSPAPATAVLSADAARLEHFGAGTGAFDLQLSRGQVFMDHDPDYFMPGGEYYPEMQEYLESLLRLKEDIERHHARMVLIWVPSKERVYVPVLSDARRNTFITNRTHEINGIERVLTRFAKLEGLSFLDLTSPLAERALAGQKLFFTVDGHWNSRGNAAAAAIIADFIRHLPEEPPPAPIDRPLYVRHGSVSVEQALASSAMTYHAPIVVAVGGRLLVKGRAASQFGYLAQWSETVVDAPRWLIAQGVVRQGGITIGMLKDGQWGTKLNIMHGGRFDIALPVSEPGRYTVLVASALPANSRGLDVEISSIGWASIK